LDQDQEETAFICVAKLIVGLGLEKHMDETFIRLWGDPIKGFEYEFIDAVCCMTFNILILYYH
jgi:hypothetical protein